MDGRWLEGLDSGKSLCESFSRQVPLTAHIRTKTSLPEFSVFRVRPTSRAR